MALIIFPHITAATFVSAAVPLARRYLIDKACQKFADYILSLHPTSAATPTPSTPRAHRPSSLERNAGEYELSLLGTVPSRRGGPVGGATRASPNAEPDATDGHIHWAPSIVDGDEPLARIDTRSTSGTRADRTAEQIDRIAAAVFAPGPHTSLAQVRSSISLGEAFVLHANAAEIEALRAKASDYKHLRPTEYHSQTKLLDFIVGRSRRRDNEIA